MTYWCFQLGTDKSPNIHCVTYSLPDGAITQSGSDHINRDSLRSGREFQTVDHVFTRHLADKLAVYCPHLHHASFFYGALFRDVTH